MSMTAVILAAGLSKRMGQPKMLLPWGKTTVLGQVITTFAACGVDEIVVITGGARKLVEAEVARLAESLPVRAVFNVQYETGEMMSSIRVGLAALGPEVDSALIGLGDQPQLSLESARKVVETGGMSGPRLIIPSYNMRRGHPWLVQRELWAELSEANTARDFLNTHAGVIFYVECDETVLKDLDTPEDYEKGLKTIR
jgi:molybdenum cofactor cytidylyltransferase